MGLMTSLEPINVDISTLRSAMNMVDPSLERESKRESNYRGFKVLKSCYKNLILKLTNLGL